MTISRFAWFVLAGMLSSLWWPIDLTRADDPDVSSSAVLPLRYRRVYVPQESIKAFTRGYMPIKRDDFEQKLAQIRARAKSSGIGAVWIRSAEYYAIFANGELTSGNAHVHVSHAGGGAAILSLAPCGLAIGGATWRNVEANEPATVGTDAAGNLVALVPASGDLQFPWTLRGETNEWGETRFDVRSPRRR